MGEFISLILPLVIFVAIMYFMIIRPQRKQMNEQQNMYDNLKPGNSIVTIGGLHGVIDEIDSNRTFIVLDCEGIYLTFDMRAVSRVVDGSGSVENNSSTDETDVDQSSTDSEE